MVYSLGEELVTDGGAEIGSSDDSSDGNGYYKVDGSAMKEALKSEVIIEIRTCYGIPVGIIIDTLEGSEMGESLVSKNGTKLGSSLRISDGKITGKLE